MKFTTSFALAALSSLAAAVEEKCLHSFGGEGPCLTSFVWCKNEPADARVCSYPENVNPVGVNSREVALFRGRKYNLSFNKLWEADSQATITWVFPSLEKGKSLYWSKNVSYTGTEGSFEFDPEAVLAEFPTPQTNMTQDEATIAAAEEAGFIRIQHANWEQDVLITGFFVVLSANAGRVADTVAEYASARRTKELSIGLGVGMGVGIPLAILITWLIARPPAFLARRMQRKSRRPVANDDGSMEWVEPRQT